jgi:hypothetical protein
VLVRRTFLPAAVRREPSGEPEPIAVLVPPSALLGDPVPAAAAAEAGAAGAGRPPPDDAGVGAGKGTVVSGERIGGVSGAGSVGVVGGDVGGGTGTGGGDGSAGTVTVGGGGGGTGTVGTVVVGRGTVVVGSGTVVVGSVGASSAWAGPVST